MYFRTGNPKGLTKSGSGELGIIVCGRVPWLYQYWPGRFMLFVVLPPGTPGGSICSGSGLKRLRRRGKWLEVSSDRLGELGILFLWPCSLAVPVLAGWVYAFFLWLFNG